VVFGEPAGCAAVIARDIANVFEEGKLDESISLQKVQTTTGRSARTGEMLYSASPKCVSKMPPKSLILHNGCHGQFPPQRIDNKQDAGTCRVRHLTFLTTNLA